MRRRSSSPRVPGRPPEVVLGMSAIARSKPGSPAASPPVRVHSSSVNTGTRSGRVPVTDTRGELAQRAVALLCEPCSRRVAYSSAAWRTARTIASSSSVTTRQSRRRAGSRQRLLAVVGHADDDRPSRVGGELVEQRLRCVDDDARELFLRKGAASVIDRGGRGDYAVGKRFGNCASNTCRGIQIDRDEQEAACAAARVHRGCDRQSAGKL